MTLKIWILWKYYSIFIENCVKGKYAPATGTTVAPTGLSSKIFSRIWRFFKGVDWDQSQCIKTLDALKSHLLSQNYVTWNQEKKNWTTFAHKPILICPRKHSSLPPTNLISPVITSIFSSCRFSIYGLRQPLSELLGYHHLRLLGFPASSDPVSHRHRNRLPTPPHPGILAPVQPARHAADAQRSGWNHAGQRAVLPFLPHAPLPPLLPAGAIRCHPGTPPLLHSHDTLCMTSQSRGPEISLTFERGRPLILITLHLACTCPSGCK